MEEFHRYPNGRGIRQGKKDSIERRVPAKGKKQAHNHGRHQKPNEPALRHGVGGLLFAKRLCERPGRHQQNQNSRVRSGAAETQSSIWRSALLAGRKITVPSRVTTRPSPIGTTLRRVHRVTEEARHQDPQRFELRQAAQLGGPLPLFLLGALLFRHASHPFNLGSD